MCQVDSNNFVNQRRKSVTSSFINKTGDCNTYENNSTFRRGGIIPFSFFNEELVFCLSQDRKTGDFGDFGGGCKRNEAPITGAYREFMEETKGCFPNIDIDYVYKNSVFFERRGMTLFFVYVDPSYIGLSKGLFKPNKEISGILWIKDYDFKWLIDENKFTLNGQVFGMWKKIVRFMSAIDEKYNFFEQMKIIKI